MIGCGDVALRAARLLSPNFRLYGLTRHPEQHPVLRAAGITPIPGDLDLRKTLARLSLSPYAVLHCAPPPATGSDDARTRNLLASLGAARSLPRTIVYISTSGVYGDCGGAQIDETHPAAPLTARAGRRAAAEKRLRRWARPARTFHASQTSRSLLASRNPPRLAIVRAPGIYAEDRLPIERLQRHVPALLDAEDVYTNHIHADDLARACIAAMLRGKPQRAYNATDDAEWKMGEYFDRIADALRFDRPPRITADDADRLLPPLQRSFTRESRRLSNARAKRELRWRPVYPTPAALLDEMRARLDRLADAPTAASSDTARE